jgi:Cu(I)/Ag(I) efflux system membrane protein CusA/SilA
MIERLILWSLHNRALVLIAALAIALWGVQSVYRTPLDAIPDLSDVQVIVKTGYSGRAPQVVEDQVTFPLSTALLAVPGSAAVRGYSMFGESYVYVIFEDGTDPYWARSRVLESLSQLGGRLPPGVTPALGPDASGVGWVFEYALIDRTRRHSLDELRALQDFFLKYELQGLPGVAEVATVGGAVRQFQVEVDPNRLASFSLTMEQVAQAIREANAAGGGSVIEMGRTEFAVRFEAYLANEADFLRIPLRVSPDGVPVRLADVAHVQRGPELRRGVADLDGEGEVTGGIIVMRHGHNALRTIAGVKQRLDELKASLPEGVELVVTYDRSGLIERAVATLRDKLIEESLAVAAVCLLFLLHLRSSLVAVVTLPLGILAAFIVMQQQGVTANIMSLGGIAIAIGTMVDAAIVMIENMHKHLERRDGAQDTWAIARAAAVEVGPALFFSLLIIAVSFLPVFALSGQEGRLFAPLAYTKTYAMAAAAGLSVTLVPVLMGYFIRGRVRAERHNPVNRFFQTLYRPVLLFALQRRGLVLTLAVLLLATVAWPLAKLGSEFMPPLDEGDLLYMPTTLPGVSVDEALNLLQITDRAIRTLPEVARVFGKAGRAETATDPAPLSMLETTIQLTPRDTWPDGQTLDQLIDKLDAQVRLPGLSNSWGYPIRTRIDMLATGIRSPLGAKITGPELAGILRVAEQVEKALKAVPGTRAAFAERAASGRYIDVVLDRDAAARYGLRAMDVQRQLQGAIGGENIDTLVAGRERFPINLRYARDFRDSLDALGASRIVNANGQQVPLSRIATIRVVDGPAEIKSENGRLVGYVFVDVAGRDLGGYIDDAARAVAEQVKLEPGYAVAWSGQYEHMARAAERMRTIVPLTILLAVLLLLMHFRDATKTGLVLLSLPFALVGGIWLVYWLGYNLSVAAAVGFIALAGVAAEFGVVMLLYLDNAWNARRAAGANVDRAALHDAIVEGALLRIRPKMMTVCVILAGLLPIMISDQTGADVMKRIAAPLVGGMITAPLLSLLVIPVLYSLWKERHPEGGNRAR